MQSFARVASGEVVTRINFKTSCEIRPNFYHPTPVRRTRFEEMDCPIAQTGAVIGDSWTMLILREAFSGTSRFSDFERRLGIPKNTLTERLEHLVEKQVFRREALPPTGKRFAYYLTPRGFDLLTLIVAAREWGNRWVYGEGKELVLLLDRRTGKPLPPLRIRDESGAPISPLHITVAPGPGAGAEIRARLAESSSSESPFPHTGIRPEDKEEEGPS